MEARGMQAAIEAITRVNSSSREEVEGDPCSSEKAITPGRLLGCAGRQCKIVFADCSNLGLLLVEGSKVVCTFHTALLIPQLAAARNLTFTQTVISLHPKPTQLESNPS